VRARGPGQRRNGRIERSGEHAHGSRAGVTVERARYTPNVLSAYAVGMEALTEARLSTWLCEYPIWFLKRWPFVKDEPAQAEGHSLRDLLKPSPLDEFNVRVGLAGVADRKRRAMAEHKSQMSRRNGDPHWHTLGDVSDGDFVECFFEAELFHCVRRP